MQLYIVGKCGPMYALGNWEFQGVFDSVDEAVSACKTKYYFVGPAVLNEKVPDETTVWEGTWYPLIESQPICP